MNQIVWFRQDLRLADNPALAHAAALGQVVPVYIFDETPPPGSRPTGSAGRWWLHHSLLELRRSLGALIIATGDPAVLLPQLAQRFKAGGVFWNRCYEPFAVARDKQLKSTLRAAGLRVASFNASLLFEPWEIWTAAGEPFKVFSPFWRSCLENAVALPTRTPNVMLAPLDEFHTSGELPAQLAPPRWSQKFHAHWHPGEASAHERLERFIERGLDGYRDLRDRPDLENVSRLSPHLHWGEISPRQVWAAISASGASPADLEKFQAELGWREFAYHLLFHFPELPRRNWKPQFDLYPWANDRAELRAWQTGMTGYPMVDAAMRELWATGFISNRARLVAASFLVKHLRIHWREGESWFWDTLLDADLANNASSWQWVTGSGADAAPYFRIFNPIEQGRRFDPAGAYVRRWCPELSGLPDARVHAPFQASSVELARAGVHLGHTYPRPIVDHDQARRAALAGFEIVNQQSVRAG